MTGVSHVSVQKWVKQLGDQIERFRPQDGDVEPVSVMEPDELWHFVQKIKNKCWVWLAYDRDGQRVCAVRIGQGDMQTAQGLWQQFKVLDLKHICTDPDCSQTHAR